VNKREENIAFFGGAVTGVQVVRFTDADRDILFTDILDVNDDELTEELYALRDMSTGHVRPVIRQDWIVSSDVFNISIVWLMHGFRNSHLLDENQRHEAQVRLCCYLIYKYLTSLLYQYFKFPADPEIAQATYAQLSYKYLLKQLGSWSATIRYLAENVVAKESIHNETINKMADDERVIYMVTNIQGNVRDMLKNIYAEFVRVHRMGIRIKSTSALVESDGELILKESSASPGVYTRYLKTIVSDKNSFIRQELIDVICSTMRTLSPRMLMQTLVWTSDNYQNAKNKDIDVALDIVMEHAIEYTTTHRELMRNDLSTLIDRLRGAYMSSRSTDEKLLKARTLVENIVKEATGTKNDSAIAAVRTAWMLYIVARSYSRRHYAHQ
jgi:hypothetical protein